MNQQPVILCVDDEFAGLRDRKLLLEQNGYEVLAANNSDEALVLFAAYAVDLAIVGGHMLGIGGQTLAEQMKSRKAHVPIIMLASEAQSPNGPLGSVDAFIAQTEHPDRLLYAISHLLDMSLLFTSGAQAKPAA